MVLHTAVLPEACVVSSFTRILWRFRWSSCVYWHGIQVLFAEVAEVNDYCLLLPSIFNIFFFSRTSHVAVDMLQDDWDWSEKFSSNISTRRLGTKGSHTPHDYTWEPHQETMLGNLANISFSYCSTVLTILKSCLLFHILCLFLQMAGRILVTRPTSLADFTKRYSCSWNQ